MVTLPKSVPFTRLVGGVVPPPSVPKNNLYPVVVTQTHIARQLFGGNFFWVVPASNGKVDVVGIVAG